MSDTVKTKIVYYCERRHQYFKRTVTVDNDLEILRKLNRATFRLSHSLDHETNKFCDVLSLMRVGNLYGQEIGSSSVPKYLFGDEYYYARRKDTSSHWNLTREAFEPREQHATV